MDELFRKAADQYPLKTDSGDWDAVWKLMNPPVDPSPVNPGGGWRFLLYFLSISPMFFLPHLIKTSPGQLTQEQKTKSVSPIAPDAVNNHKSSKKLITGKQLDKLATVPATEVALRTKTEKKTDQDVVGIIVADKGKLKPTFNKKSIRATSSFLNTYKNDGNKQLMENPVTKADDESASHKKTEKKKNEIADSDKKVDTGKINNSNTVQNKIVDSVLASKYGKANKSGGFYLGVAGGVDISSVKMQDVKGPGYNIGVLAGYRLSKRVAFETGLLWAKKYYYSDGKYFNTSKLPYTPGRKIMEVDGWCEMFELPVNIRYSFIVKKKSSFYAAAGLSSYIMNKEKYTYLYNHNGNVYPTNKSYSNETRNWFSIINMAVGYERSIGNKARVRIEPYIKVPVNGIGFGSLPVSSFGVNLGFTIGQPPR